MAATTNELGITLLLFWVCVVEVEKLNLLPGPANYCICVVAP